MTMQTKVVRSLSLALVLGALACSSSSPPATCALFLPAAAGAADAGVCIPDDATCAAGGGQGIGDLCKSRNQACVPMAGGARCGACLTGFALDSGSCTTQRTCASLDCSGQGRACNPEAPNVHASCGACLAGSTDVSGHCAQITCGAAQGTASLAGACAALHRVCVAADTGATCGACAAGYEDASGTCIVASTCAAIGCDGLHRSCTPAAGGMNASCGTCLPGYLANGATCVADPAATCAGGDGGVDAGSDASTPGSISASCATLHRACAATGGGASCGACLLGYVLDPSSNACLAMKSCADLACAAQHQMCVDTPTGHCAGCLDGFVADATTGACRAPTACFDAKTAPQGLGCPTGQECVPATSSTDAYCRPGCDAGQLWNGRQCAPCPKCDGDGEDGAWSSATAAGVCICKTKPGYFYSVAGAMGAFACDADGDGWVRESARSALESTDPNLSLNGRCALRTIDRFVYANEAGQTKTSMLPAPLALYETDRNDDDVILGATWALAGLPDDRGMAPVGASELNRLTKLCRSPSADYDDDGVADVFEFGGQTPSPQLRAEQAAFEANAYFSELYWGAYVAGAAGAAGQYVIHEKSRRADATIPSEQRVQLGYAATDDPSWRTCPLQRDASWNKTSAPIGMDYASISDPASPTFSGLNLESQFKCLVVDPDPAVDHLNAMPTTALVSAGYRAQSCALTTAATPVTGNASLTDFTCTSVDPSKATAGQVLWGAVPYLPNGPFASDPPYQRGCVSACVADLPICEMMATPVGGVVPPIACTSDATKFGANPVCSVGKLCEDVTNADNSLVVDVGGACTVSHNPPLTGVCAQGQIVCQNHAKVCAPVQARTTEVCNGLDDDCDGIVDDVAPYGHDVPNPFLGPAFPIFVPDQCDTGLLGACQAGTYSCVNGAKLCQGAQPTAEICNNYIDDNCNGQVDESPPIAPGADCPANMFIFYRDEDGDGWPTMDSKCLCGPEAPYVLRKDLLYSNSSGKLDPLGNLRVDCCDTDNTTYPDADFQVSRDNCHSFDRNCDGLVTQKYFANDSGCSSGTSCGGASYTYQYATPACGDGGYINTSCTGWPGCHRNYDVYQLQQCK
jgi:hypothetical protein